MFFQGSTINERLQNKRAMAISCFELTYCRVCPHMDCCSWPRAWRGRIWSGMTRTHWNTSRRRTSTLGTTPIGYKSVGSWSFLMKICQPPLIWLDAGQSSCFLSCTDGDQRNPRLFRPSHPDARLWPYRKGWSLRWQSVQTGQMGLPRTLKQATDPPPNRPYGLENRPNHALTCYSSKFGDFFYGSIKSVEVIAMGLY